MPRIVIDLSEQQYKSWSAMAAAKGLTIETFIKRCTMLFMWAKRNEVKKKVGQQLHVKVPERS